MTKKELKDVKHTVLKKDEALIKNISAFIKDESRLAEEFKLLEDQVIEHVKETTNEAKAEENLPHNRYKDIGITIHKMQSA